MIEFKNVSKAFNETTVLKEQSFTINDGELVVLVGPSGSGKTTLLKMINRLIDPSTGQILIDKVPQDQMKYRDMRLEMGYVLQQIALFPNLTVAENIALIPEMKDWSKNEILKESKKLLDIVGLEPDQYLNCYPKDLSGGEQQRVGIVRAIIARPKILLMDEPFSALDPISRKQLQDLTLKIHKDYKMTIVFVTHDIDESMILADRIAVLHQGVICQMDAPEIIQNSPANDFVKGLFGGHVNV
ncbi:hypothetical protein HMPREF9318_00338 [Streptococcus urinalis FB127-CNA-2]|uniref:ABC-type quaternary amine transporter n=1 Tax=Streptococcus urinalis 2285-97 TaxID=764291 RepID=G5KFS9_9STRE|nr:ABC transporter ATP-binding protein [Streptococcus urinalis]EHJ57648.1 ABC transporter, ATP-binding protein [Streptococcus urinalis 2285-97]EKS22140.1 hypothetical protein HMPREF9318_00338 [Streptococcus urinalis FB127-CNA-2]VEF31952.1 ABC transporter [Streptococcus urinalis]